MRSWKGGEIPTLAFPSIFQESWLPSILGRKCPAWEPVAQGTLPNKTAWKPGKVPPLFELQFVKLRCYHRLSSGNCKEEEATCWEAGNLLGNWVQCPPGRSSLCPSHWAPGSFSIDSTTTTPNSPSSPRLWVSHQASASHATQLPAWCQAPSTGQVCARGWEGNSASQQCLLIRTLPSEKAVLWHQGCAEALGLKSMLRTSC